MGPPWGALLSNYFDLLFFSRTRPGRTVALILTLNGSNDVFPHNDGPLGVTAIGDVIWRKYAPKLTKNGCEYAVSRQNAKMYTSQYLRNYINPTNKWFQDRVQTMKSTSWVVRHYLKTNTTWLTAAILKIDMTSDFRTGWTDLDEIWYSDAERHADCGEMVGIETGSRIPIWRTFVFRNRKWLYLSRELRYVDEICFVDRLWPSEYSSINKDTGTSGNSIEWLRSPSWKIDMTSYFRSGWSDLNETQQPDAR